MTNSIKTHQFTAMTDAELFEIDGGEFSWLTFLVLHTINPGLGYGYALVGLYQMGYYNGYASTQK